MKRSGRKSLSQTKAPLKEQIKGSKTNPKGSASSKSKASKITLSEKIVDILKKKKDNYNKSHTKDVDTNSLKAVMRRGMGAYSTSHRPGMTRQGWGFARVNKFLEKKSGKKVKKAYIQDDDLLKKGGALKPSKNISQIAKERGVSLLYASTQLRKGMKVESEHSKFKYAQKTIALQHLDENIDYYKKLAKMESSFEKGGELNPDDPKLKNTMIHKSGSAGGVLVGKRHSEGGIKAINKSSNSPLEMEGGEVVITRNAVSDNEKKEFEGKMMTNREILSKINEDGGGVAFADGGKVEKEADCGCDDDEDDDDKMANGGNLNWGEDLGGGFSIGNDVYIIDTKSLFNGKTGYISGTLGRDLLVTISQDGNERNIVVSKKGVEKLDAPEFNHGGDTNSKIYKGFEIGSDGTYKIPNIKNFGIKHHDLPPSEAFKKLYSHTFEDGGEIYKDGGLIQIIDKQVPSMVAFENAFNHLNFHSVKNAYKQHLQKMYNVTFIELPHRIQMALLLGNQKLVDKFINE
jgi:hypothetical protein